MIEFLDALFIPHVGGFTTGDHAELGEVLEKQLIASGKAKLSKRKSEKIEQEPMGESPGLTDD